MDIPDVLTVLIFATAIDRVHRIGQEKTVYVKHFIVSRSSLILICPILTVGPGGRSHYRRPYTPDPKTEDRHRERGLPRER